MSPDELSEVLRLHKLWLYGVDRGERADLRGANFEGVKNVYCTVNFNYAEYEQAKQFVEGLKNEVFE